MRPEVSTHITLPKSNPQPPPRLPSWGQPPVDEPIIDAARISLQAFGASRSRHRTMAMFLWLRALRPTLTLAVWFVAVWYAWPHVLGAQSKPEVINLLILYAFIVSFIIICMLLIAPLRYLQRQREQAPEDEVEPSSLFALASYMGISPTRLSAWQRTKQLVVRHHSSGVLEDATDSEISKLEVPKVAPLRSHQ